MIPPCNSQVSEAAAALGRWIDALWLHLDQRHVMDVIGVILYRTMLYEVLNIGNNQTVSLNGLIAGLEQTPGRTVLIDRQLE